MAGFLYFAKPAEMAVPEVTPCIILKKEVIQPQVPLGLPCYDFTPVTNHTLAACVFEKFAQLLLVQPTPVV